MTRHRLTSIRGLQAAALAVLTALLAAACASMGRPQGGPRDTEPPVMVRSTPAVGELSVSGNKVIVEFNENIQLDDPTQKIVISPVQQNAPQISSNARRVTIELRDTLQPNTTYTIDFADAVKDLNEGNVLDGFAIDFSTGPELDSLRISGMVFEAETLEPAQGMLVGAYLDGADTLITTRPFDRITKTNQLGQFTLRNLKPGSYRIYALTDNNRDFHWDRSEDIAFLDSLVTPTASRVSITDTIRTDDGRDSVASLQYTSYRPNDVLLTWFNQKYQAQYLTDHSRPTPRQLSLTFAAPSDTLPELRLLNGPRSGASWRDWATLVASPTRDTLVYWIHDTTVIAQDSLLVEARYLRTDSTDALTAFTDTLKLNVKRSKARDKEETKKSKKEAEGADSVPSTPHMEMRLIAPSPMDLNQQLLITAATPIARLDSAGVRMEMMVDTLWVSVEPPRFEPLHAHNRLIYRAEYPWAEGTKYRLSVDSAAVADIYGLPNKPQSTELTTLTEADYSNLYINITGPGTQPAFVELLAGDRVAARAPVVDGLATFTLVKPADYYVRLIIDRNGNGKWDTGMLLEGLQPEEVYYYPRALSLKKNWDVEQSWDIYATALDLQKPDAIKKNKPKKPAGTLPADNTDDLLDEEIDETAPGYNPFDPKSAKKKTQ